MQNFCDAFGPFREEWDAEVAQSYQTTFRAREELTALYDRGNDVIRPRIHQIRSIGPDNYAKKRTPRGAEQV